MSISRRLAKLEERTDTGAIEYVGIGRFDWTPEQLAQAIAEAEARVGPHGRVIAFSYVSDWRGAEEASTP